MKKIPCRKCPKCGLYHDFSLLYCEECGCNLESIPVTLVNINDIPGDKYGIIDENIAIFVQKCSYCGTLNFTSSADAPVKKCYKCQRTRIQSIDPIEYIEDDSNEKENSLISSAEAPDIQSSANKNDAGKTEATLNNAIVENDAEVEKWIHILGNIQKAISSSPTVDTNSSNGITDNSKNDAILNPFNDESDEDDADWGSILGVERNPQSNSIEEKASITLTAITYGQFTFTVEANDGKSYLLGRSANQHEFLKHDPRVGNEHCYLVFKNGYWYVIDNHSSNGTAVNSQDIGLDGKRILNNGDELKLGHHPDSMAFRITIH